MEVRLPRPEEKAGSFDENWTCIYIVHFHLGLKFLISGSLMDLIIHYDLAPTQFMLNTWRTFMALIILAESISVELSYQDIVNLFTLSENKKDFKRYVLSPKKDLVVISGNHTSIKEWKD